MGGLRKKNGPVHRVVVSPPAKALTARKLRGAKQVAEQAAKALDKLEADARREQIRDDN
jgi:hypothetical protein